MRAPTAIRAVHEVPHPWRRLAEQWPDVPVLRRDLGSPFLHAETRWRAGRPVAVVLNRALTQVQARCAVAHECEHLDRGRPCDSLRTRIEHQVALATARYLLPDLDAVVRAATGQDLARAADELWVTRPVLLDRLRSLTDRERAALDATVPSRLPDTT